MFGKKAQQSISMQLKGNKSSAFDQGRKAGRPWLWCRPWMLCFRGVWETSISEQWIWAPFGTLLAGFLLHPIAFGGAEIMEM